MAYESDAGATGPVPNLALDIDANVMDYATYHRYADHINIARLKGGWSVNIAYHYIQGAAVAPLRHFGIHQATYERQEDRYFALVGDPFRGGHRTGDLGTIAAPYTGLISGLADSYTITHQDMLRNGGKMLQLSGTGSITVSVENGFFVGQELVLLKGGNPSTMQMATGGNLGLGASGVVLTSGEVLSLWWSGSFWHGR